MGLLTDLRADWRQLGDRAGSWFDAFVAPVVFAAANAVVGTRMAAVVAVAVALLLVAWRLVMRKPVRYAVAGVGGTIVAASYAAFTGRGEDYFVPGVISSVAYGLVFLGTALGGRPAVAWVSMWTRRYPARWFDHPRVRPAYAETTLLWAAFFLGRAWWLGRAIGDGDVTAAAAIRVGSGWPAIAVLIVVTQIYGRWRLRRLGGPGPQELDLDPPWEGHRGGF